MGVQKGLQVCHFSVTQVRQGIIEQTSAFSAVQACDEALD